MPRNPPPPPRNVRLNLDVDEQLHAQIREISDETEVPAARLIRRWVRQGVDAWWEEHAEKTPTKTNQRRRPR